MLFRGFPHNPHLSAHIFLTSLRLTFAPQNTVDVPLNNVVFHDLFFQPAIVGVELFFLLSERGIFRLQRGDVGELAADQRGLDRFCGGLDVYKRQAFTKAILRLTRRSFTRLLQAPTVRTGRFCGFPARPGRIASGSATFS